MVSRAWHGVLHDSKCMSVACAESQWLWFFPVTHNSTKSEELIFENTKQEVCQWLTSDKNAVNQVLLFCHFLNALIVFGRRVQQSLRRKLVATSSWSEQCEQWPPQKVKLPDQPWLCRGLFNTSGHFLYLPRLVVTIVLCSTACCNRFVCCCQFCYSGLFQETKQLHNRKACRRCHTCTVSATGWWSTRLNWLEARSPFFSSP